jgi:hypothetical protein
MPQFPGHHGFLLKTLQEVRIASDDVADNLDGAYLVEGKVPDPVDNAHATDADPIQNLVLIADDHPGLKFVSGLQTGLIRGTHVIVGRIRLMTHGTVFHCITPIGQKAGDPGWSAKIA